MKICFDMTKSQMNIIAHWIKMDLDDLDFSPTQEDKDAFREFLNQWAKIELQ